MPLALVSGVVVLVVLLLGLRRRTVLRIAFRDFGRRPAQSLLVVAGLLVASLVLAASLVAADSMEALFLENVYRSWGAVDVQVGTISGQAFAYERALEIAYDPEVVRLSDGRAARLQIRAAAEAPGPGTREPRVGIVGIDAKLDGSLGPLNADPLGPETFPGAGETIINRRLARELHIAAGDRITFNAVAPTGRIFVLTLTVKQVVGNAGKADWQRLPNAFVPLAALQEAAGAPNVVNQVLISARGGEREPVEVRRLEKAARSSAERARLVVAGRPVPLQAALTIAGSKADDVEAARGQSKFFRAILGMLGAIVALTSVALIVNLFVMLGEERRGELGTMRALGLRKAGLVQLGLSEGVLYSIAAAFAGALIGAPLGRYLADAMGDLFTIFARNSAVEFARPPFSLKPETLLTAGGAGFLVSVISVAFVSYKTSRLTVIAAIRGLPEDPSRRRRRIPYVQVLAVLGGAGLLAGEPIPIVLGGASIALGLGGLVARYLNRRAGSTLGALAGLGWGFWCHAYLDPGFQDDPNGAFAFFAVVGVVTVLAGVVLLAANLTLLGRGASAFGARARAVIATATAYAAGYRFKTALSMAMFALVLYMIAGFAVWGNFGAADFEEQSGGFDVFARSTLPLPALEVEGASRVVGLYAARYELGYKVGGGEEIRFPIVLYGVDDGFARTNTFGFSKKPGGLSDEEVWRRLVDSEDSVVMDGGTVPAGGVEVGEVLELKTDTGVRKLEVAAVADEFLFSAVWMPKRAFAALYPTRAADTVWLMKSAPGASPARIARSVERDHPEAGMDARLLRDIFDEIAQGQRTFVGLFQILLKMGLVIGISGLAISAVRTVLERRQAVGVLRAMGFQRSMITAWLVSESVLVATLGVAIGLGVGLLGTYLVVNLQVPEFTFSVDWSQIRSTLAILYGAVLLFTTLPAIRAARLRPAEAVRYVE